MTRKTWMVMVAAVVLVVAPGRLPAPNSTRASVGSLDGAVNRDLGVQVDWNACNCLVSATEFEIAPGQTLPTEVTAPAKLAARGVAGAKQGDAVSVTWQGGDRWQVRHEASGKQFAWRWKMPPVEQKK